MRTKSKRTTWNPSAAGRTGVHRFAMATLAMASLTLFQGTAASQVTYTEEGGALRDGTRYLMRVPSNWNGTLLRDLDYLTNVNDARYLDMLVRGYAVSGTARHSRRWAGYYDPAREIAHLDTVLDLFVERFRKPDRVIQYGCSGGGHVTLAVAEDFSGRIDGAIAWAAHTPVWLMNSWLDGWFVLKALLAPDQRIVELPSDGSLRPAHAPLVFAWRQVVDAAQKTPEGRARLALAVTIGQWPEWVNPTVPSPDPSDIAALQHSMYQTIHRFTINVGGISRYMLERAAGIRPAQLSWNTGIDYEVFFGNGNARHTEAVRTLYQEAGLNLEADLETVNAFARIAADAEALEYRGAPGRTVTGNPKIPVLRIHDVGDHLVPERRCTARRSRTRRPIAGLRLRKARPRSRR